jgi:transposase
MPSFSPVGVDLAKANFEVGLLPSPGQRRSSVRRFANTQVGFDAALVWMQSRSPHPVHVCLEATGTYHDGLTQFLIQAGVRVSVIPSSRLPAFRTSEGKRSKTDEQDAVLLARYCQQKQPSAYEPPSPELLALRQLLERYEDLQALLQQEANRRENSRWDDFVCRQIQQHLQQLETWQQETLQQALELVSQQSQLHDAFLRLQQLKGVAQLTALRLVALLGPDGKRFGCARQLIAYVGLDVVERQSGTSVHGQGKISKQGPSHVRKWLALPAQVAMRWDPDMRQWSQELEMRGKCFKLRRVAAMRKLLHLAYGLLKHEQDYDRQVAWPTHQQQEGNAA